MISKRSDRRRIISSILYTLEQKADDTESQETLRDNNSTVCLAASKYSRENMLSPRQFWILALLFGCNWCENVTAVGELTLVDQLTADYLIAEKELWDVILKRDDTTLQQMYNVHTLYLNHDLGGSNVLLNGTYVKSADVVAESVIQINQTSHDIAEEFFERRNYTVLSEKANKASDLTAVFDAILKSTIESNDFLDQLAAVSAHNG